MIWLGWHNYEQQQGVKIMECIRVGLIGEYTTSTISDHPYNNRITTNSMASLALLSTETTTTTGTTCTTESSSAGLAAGADVHAATSVVKTVILPTSRDGNSETTPVLTYNLSKYDRGLLSPEALKEYKKRSKNEKQKAASQCLSPSKRKQKLAMCAFRKREQRYKKKMDGVKTLRKKTYVSIQDKSPSEQEEQRLIWKKWKANLRKKSSMHQAADSKARRRVIELQARLVNAESNLEQASDLSSKDRGTPKELLSLRTIVDTCKEDLCSMQHLVDCHEAGADHDVYGVFDCEDCDNVNVDSNYNEDKGGQTTIDESCTGVVCCAKVGHVVGVNIKFGNNDVWNFQDNIHVESDGTFAAVLPGKESLDASFSIETNGKCSESAITFVDDDGYDSSSPTPCLTYLYCDQQHRFESTMVQVFGYAHTSFWECRGNGALSSTGTEIARSRVRLLSIQPNDPGVSDLRDNKVGKKFGPDEEKLHSLVTFKWMFSDAIFVRNNMTRRDFRQLLTKTLYVTDAFIYMYSALLLERDHAMYLAIPGWQRSWIYGSHFYAQLSPNSYLYNYDSVKKHGSRQVPGNTKNPSFLHFPTCVFVLPLYI